MGSSDSDEDNMAVVSEDGWSEDFSFQKDQRPCCFCCTAQRVYHVAYIVLFSIYLLVFPLWAKWLICAPMPYVYWNDDLDPFPMLPLKKTNISNSTNSNLTGLPGLSISAIPTDHHSCNLTCGEDYLGFRTGLMNFEVAVSLNQQNLMEENVHTTYPVLLASQDFKDWQLVADRRHASPDPFFISRTASTGEAYVHTTEMCMSMPTDNVSLTSRGVYILGCVTWRVASQQALQDLTSATAADLNQYCDSVGGVCGWPCGSNIPSSRLEGCSRDGIIQGETLAQSMPMASRDGNVSVFSCLSPSSHPEDCTLSTQAMSQWPCHKCQQELDEADAGFITGDDDDGASVPGEGGFIGDDDDDDDDDDFGGFLRRLQAGDELEETIHKRYLSLPQMQVKMYNSKIPPGSTDLFNTPRSFVFAASSLNGPWRQLYSSGEVKSVPVGMELPKTKITRRGDFLNAMQLERMNALHLNSESCFGKRGPMYLVACAVNSSIYEDETLWRHSKPRFKLGQKVAPPPFNDRCVAVAGRCGHACTEKGTTLPYCDAFGHIHQEYLVGNIPIQYNRMVTVMAFIIVLLCGFSVKAMMLCPGIFSPYRHAHDYDPEMTESFRYIAVCAPVAGADENKGTMLRNLVGAVSCMPPECRCRYHVALNDEGHRNEMKTCWELFCRIIDAVPNFGGETYEQNVLEFMSVWCKETRMMTLPQIGGKVKVLDDSVVDRLTGQTAVKKLLKESRWRNFQKAHLTALEGAMEALAQDLRSNYNQFTLSTPYLDNISDWAPRNLSSLPLRMHYISRAKPVEDSRNIMVQHVAVGSWYYKVPRGATTADWLALRKRPKEMVYALPDNDENSHQVPLRSSHGKAGGLNFVDNYLSMVAMRPQNIYDDDRDEAPTLFAIADARHQFQPDFMLSCIPCFFTVRGILNTRVSFTQAPQHYPEYADASDYMDYNNAQFFRLNSMIRNCCGGCTSCGTNGMWLIDKRDDTYIWDKRQKRVRDQDGRRREQLIEREQFHTSCKIEDTASSLDQILQGRHSHYVNRKLSFGMAKAPTDFIGAQQRWVEGAVTLALQWFSGNADAHGSAAKNGWMLWMTVLAFALFVASLIRLVVTTSTTSIFVEYGALSEDTFNGYFYPIRDFVWSFVMQNKVIKHLLGVNHLHIEVYINLLQSFLVWTLTAFLFFSIVVFVTVFAKFLSQCCRVSWPNELRWWGRLMISMDNLTYFIWFWTSFFWVGFNYYTALFEMHFHFNNLGMMSFMMVVNLLNWGLIICNSMRYSVMESVDANEVATLSMDNIWRSNQLFFMTGPVQLFSIVRGISEFIKYKFYGQDIGGWSGGDLGRISVNIVKYWTTLLLLGCAVVWICYGIYAHRFDNSLSSCIVVTMISLDVLHPCIFLWFGNADFHEDELAKMTCCQCLMSLRWWKSCVKSVVLNTTTTTFLKFLAPAYFLALPILALCSSYFGLAGAYMLVAVGPGH